MLTIDRIGCSLRPAWSKDHLLSMIERLGREETARRFAWLFDGTEREAGEMIDALLTDDYVDEKGVKGGHDFWGDY